MITDLESETIEQRETANIEAAEKIRRGTEEFSFAMEGSPKAAAKLDWNTENIDKWNSDSVDYASTINRVEHADAWALQRDVNYAYSGRKRLMTIGIDSRFSGPDGARYYGSDLIRMDLEDPSPPTNPNL